MSVIDSTFVCPLTRLDCSHVAVGAHPGCLFPQRGVLRPFGLDEVVFHQDSGCRQLYRVKSGLLGLRRYHPDGGRTVARVVRPGQIVGWADAFISGIHRWEAWGLSPGSLWLMSAADWAASHPGDAHGHTLAMAYSESLQLENALMRLSRLTVENRVLAFLLSLAPSLDKFPVEITSPIRRGDLAEVVAIRPESCSRAMRRLQEGGLLTWTSRNTVLIDQRALDLVGDAIDLF